MEVATLNDTIAPTSIYRKWLTRLEDGVFSASQCRQWAHAVAPMAMDFKPMGARTNLRPHEARSLREFMHDRNGVALDAESTDRGLDWLRRNHSDIKLPSSTVGDILADFERFSFHGQAYLLYGASESELDASYPMWRVHFDDRVIQYWRSPWQAQAWFPHAPPGDWSWWTP